MDIVGIYKTDPQIICPLVPLNSRQICGSLGRMHDDLPRCAVAKQ